MRLTYVGPFGAVLVPLEGSYMTVEVAHGDDADFPDELAKSLLEQPANWQKAGKKPQTPDGEE